MILLNNPHKTITPLILVLVLLIKSLSQAAPEPPSIVSFSPTVGSIGTEVTLTGTNFSSIPTNNIVYFGATKATVTAATATQLTVTVPTGATYAPITVLNTLTGLLAYSNSNFTPTFTPNKGDITSSDFSAKVDFTPGLNPFSVAIADLDDDGKADLAVANYGSNSVSVFRNTSSIGSVSYAAKIDHTTGSAPLFVATGDLDGDGKADLAVTNGNTVSVFRNTSSSGNISFATKVDISSTNPTSMAIGDLDGDGKADLAVTNESSNTVSVFRNTGSSGIISFAAQVGFTTGTTPISVAISDFNGDGKADLAVGNVYSNTISVFRNTGNTGIISYAAKEDLAVETNPYSVDIGDLDGDGKPDLAVANFSSNIVSVFRNNGSSGTISYAPKVDFITGDNPLLVRIGDLNGDGKPDLGVANYGSNTVSVFRNTGSTGIISYAAKVDLATGSTPYSVGIADLDGDGRADLAVANFNSSTVSIIRNNPFFVSPPTITSFTPTSGGTGTVVTLTGTNFTGATAVNFGGTAAASFTVASATSIPAVIASGASGNVSVTTPGGTATIAGFTYIPTIPTIASFTPTSGPVGTSVIISGTNFSTISSNNIVYFGATKAAVTVATATQLTVTVPTGATYEPITVLNTVIGLLAYSSSNFTPTFTPNKGDITTTDFSPKVDYTTGTTPQSVAIGDLDGDGKADLAVANLSSATVSVFRNTGSSGTISYAAKVDFTTGTEPRSVAIGDLDGDGKADLVVANPGSTTVSVFRNTGSTGTISYAAKVDLTSTRPISVAIGDLDGDGKADLAVANESSSMVSLIRNNPVFVSPPTIASFTPTSAGAGATVTITGTNFTGATVVSFGGTAATSFTVLSPTIIIAVVGSGSSGSISVTSSGGTATIAGFTFIPTIPTIASFTPTNASTRTTVTLTGTNFTGATAVSFGGTAATSFTVVSATSITAVIANGASGNVSVTTPGGIATLAGFTFITPPIITGFTPNVGIFGTSVTITGTNFGVAPANNIVKFNGTTATIISNTTTSITTTVPVGATTGPITVTVNGQTATSSTSFTVIFPPTITSFTPAIGIIGAQVTITGTNFSITPANNIVKFNGTIAAITGTPTATSITTTVPTGATTGKITVEVDSRTATSTTNFSIGSVSRLGRFLVDKISGCAPLTVTILDTNLITSGECTPGKPCVMSLGNGTTNQQNQFIFTFNQPGTYKLSVLYQSIGADDITITVNGPTVTAGPPSTICPGTFAVISASGANSYRWSPINGLSSTTGNSIMAMPSVTTTYTVTGTDLTGCTNTATLTVNVNSQCTIPNLVNGKSIESYRIFSIPLKLADKRIESVIASVLQQYGGYDQEKWRLVHYSNGNNLNYTEGLSTIEEGKGYWLLSADPTNISIAGTAIDVSFSNPFKVSLNKGWNQIGNPFGFDVSWSDVLAQNSGITSVGKLYVYDPITVSFKESNNLKAWGGGFINTISATNIQIPITVKPASGGRMVKATEIEENSIDQPSWFVPIQLSHNEGINDLGGIGMHVDASVGRDVHDENSLPRFIKYLELNSYHEDYFQPKFMRDVVPSTSNYNWNLHVESNFGEGDVKLSWEHETLGRNNAQLLLCDKQAKVIIDMKKVGEYKFRSPATRELTIMYAIDEKHLSTESLKLGLPFPNPLVLETTIPFITGADEILINVYDMLGRKVKEVARSNFETGYHEIVWQGDDYLGEHVSPGMYIIRVSGSNSPAASVRILVK